MSAAFRRPVTMSLYGAVLLAALTLVEGLKTGGVAFAAERSISSTPYRPSTDYAEALPGMKEVGGEDNEGDGENSAMIMIDGDGDESAPQSATAASLATEEAAPGVVLAALKVQSAAVPSYARTWFHSGIISWLTWLVLAGLAYFLVYPHIVPELDIAAAPSAERTMLEGHFDCFRDYRICLCACFCPGLRWADTISMSDFLPMWLAFAFYAMFAFLNYLAFGVAVFGIFTACLLLYYRQRLRSRFDLPYGTFRSVFFDCCFVMWCPWCAIAQEARAVSEGYKEGHTAVGEGPVRRARAKHLDVEASSGS